MFKCLFASVETCYRMPWPPYIRTIRCPLEDNPVERLARTRGMFQSVGSRTHPNTIATGRIPRLVSNCLSKRKFHILSSERQLGRIEMLNFAKLIINSEILRISLKTRIQPQSLTSFGLLLRPTMK
jgi:hypothetical protein